MSQHATWNLGDVAWDSRSMVMIPAAGADAGIITIERELSLIHI